jgi:hypothetical protein
VAQTKRKRNRKRRGTQAGSIDTRKKSRPRNRQEARAQAKSGGGKSSKARAAKADTPPNWKGATMRGAIASVVFVALLIILFKRSPAQALPIGLFMLVFYIPAGYYMDLMLWRRRERARMRAGGK